MRKLLQYFQCDGGKNGQGSSDKGEREGRVSFQFSGTETFHPLFL